MRVEKFKSLRVKRKVLRVEKFKSLRVKRKVLEVGQAEVTS